MADNDRMPRRAGAALTYVNMRGGASPHHLLAAALEKDPGDFDGDREQQHHQPGARVRCREHQHDAEDEKDAGDDPPRCAFHARSLAARQACGLI